MKKIIKPILLMLLILSMLSGFVACNTTGDKGMHVITPSNGLTPDSEGISPDRIPESQAGGNSETETPVGTKTPSVTDTPTPTLTPTPTPTPTLTPIVPSNPFLEYTQFIPSEKLIAVTFNDGPSSYTGMILDKLDGTDGKVTFFVTGERLQREDSERAKVTARGIEAGHEYAFLSWANDGENSRYTNMTIEELHEEIANTNKYLKQLGGSDVSIIRPVGGGRYMDTGADYGYPCILWSVDARDWEFAGQAAKGTITKEEAAQKIYENIVNDARPGAIVLMQDIYEVSAEAFAMAYDALTAQGYKFVTVSEMLQIQGKNADGYTFYSTYHAMYHGVRCSN